MIDRLRLLARVAVTSVVLLRHDVHGARLDRDNLMEFHVSPDRVAAVRTINDWQQRRAEILAGVQAVMGPLPEPARRVPLDVRVMSETDGGTCVRREITYLAEPGSRVPAFLLLPKVVLAGTTRRPGVLCLMSTNNREGVRAVVGLGGPNARPGRNYAAELAERGYVVMAPAYPMLADYRPDLKQLGYASGSMKGIWDNIRALDLLDATPGVAPGGYGAIGLSLGGHNAIFTAIFDGRIKVVVSACGFDSFADYRDEAYWRPGQGWATVHYMPRILDYQRADIPFDFQELVGVLAPRPFLAIAARRDRIFKWQSVGRVISAARPVYQLQDAADRLAVEFPDCEHDFPPEMRELAYRWLDRFLRTSNPTKS